MTTPDESKAIQTETATPSEAPPAAAKEPEIVANPNAIVFHDSSNVRGATLDPATGVVEVTFANGTSYKYQNFTAELMTEWSSSNSAGKWFHARVKSHPELYPLVGSAPVVAPAPAPVEAKASRKTEPAASSPSKKAAEPAPAVAPEAVNPKQWWRGRPWRGLGNGATTPAKTAK